MEKQEMEMETEMEMEVENWNGNSCTLVLNHWTGLLDLPILPLLVRAEAKCAYYLYLSLGQMSFLESDVGIGQRSHAYLISFNK